MSQNEAVCDLLDRIEGSVLLQMEGKAYLIAELDSYGFRMETAEGSEWDPSELHRGRLELNGTYELPVHFRARRRTADGYRCSLHDMSLADQGVLDEMVQEVTRATSGDTLQALSYDQIADGAATAEGAGAGAEQSASKPGAPRSRASLIGILMVAAMIVIAAVVGMLLKGRSSLELRNSTLAGNYIPLSADMDSQVAELYVKEGDTVTTGQPLYRLVSRERDAERETVRVQLDTAIAEQRAAQLQVADYSKQLEVATRALEGRLAVVLAELEQAKGDHAYAITQVDRLRPLFRSGAVKPIEYDEAVASRDSLGRAKLVKEAVVQQLEIGREALRDGVIIDERGALDARKSDLDTRLTLANVKLSEARQLLAQVESLADPASVVAPADGTVYSLYRGESEFVRSGEPVLSISGAEASWAIGHIDAEQATKVRPGQKVYVNVPSVGVRAEGRVVSVGHRGLYAQGDWSADFRATLPTDVPIKVQLPDLPVDLPSGIRLDMVVTLDKVWPWQKSTIDVAWGAERESAPLAPGEPITLPKPAQASVSRD